jgi:hypothetical protein|tara:strand:- start:214 stop:465 length:252 start_codon:yes stop_codon:yes gene_type:complete
MKLMEVKKMYSIKVNVQNLSKNFVCFENDNLSYDQAANKLQLYNNKLKEFKQLGIQPTIKDNNNRACVITGLEIIENSLFNGG